MTLFHLKGRMINLRDRMILFKEVSEAPKVKLNIKPDQVASSASNIANRASGQKALEQVETGETLGAGFSKNKFDAPLREQIRRKKVVGPITGKGALDAIREPRYLKKKKVRDNINLNL